MIEVKKQQSLRSFTSMQINVKASYFIEIRSEKQLQQLLIEQGYQSPLYILGGGSNVVFLDDFDGTILYINIVGINKIRETDNFVWIRANAGENWHQFVLYTLENNYGGLENLSLIPGKVGASPMQNIGAYGVEIKDVFEELEAIEIATGKRRVFTNDECKFGYRESIFKTEFKGKFIITSVTFRLSKKHHKLHTSYGAIQDELTSMGIDHPSIQDVSKAVIAIRESKLPDPKEIPNTGSFFKNPSISSEQFLLLKNTYPQIPGYSQPTDKTKVPAGWLIEQAGWKGYRDTKVGVHHRQALVLINHNDGSGQEIYDLSEKIVKDVNQKFGIKLEREVNIIP